MKTLLSIISILIISILSACGTQSTEPATESIQYTYTVTQSSNGEYHAIAEDQTGLYFTESELTESVEEGDTITATFEGNEDDSPFTVSKSDKPGTMIMAEDGSYVHESFYDKEETK